MIQLYTYTEVVVPYGHGAIHRNTCNTTVVPAAYMYR